MKPVESGEIKKVVAPKIIFDKISINLKRDSMGSDIEIGNTDMNYDIINGVLIPVYFTDVVYKGEENKMSAKTVFYPAIE